MSSRIGVDIGGTFTDLLFYDDDSGSVLVEKVPTTPARPQDGCVQAVRSALSHKQLATAEYFLHGTTVGLNALLERKGAIVGLLATEGFRDVLEIRRGSRDDMYNLFWTPPLPLVPRNRRLPVGERVRADGSIHRELNTEHVLAALEEFKRQGVTAIAVSFLNAYANPEHELIAERILREAGFDGAVSLSHRVSGEYRDYERTSTAVIDAFVRAKISGYLSHIAALLAAEGFKGVCLVTRSGSGSMTFAEAQERPFETIMSGPVAGAEGAAELSRNLALGDLVTADVGGTSFDTCLIVDGRPQLLYEGNVAGMPVQTPWVDVRSIGAGGGSIAQVDAGGLLQVGPESAGAEPGPACYGRGGTAPTVTDAAFFLGMLGEGHLASGVNLDLPRAASALTPLARRLDYDPEQTACGIIAIAGANMANAIREITVEQGIDPRELKLLAFGGAGPMMATQLSRELSIREILVPMHAGNFSAWGLLGSDLLQSAAQTRIITLSDAGLKEANGMLTLLFDRIQSRQHAGTHKHSRILETSLDMRYQGQEHSLTVPVPNDSGRISLPAGELAESFSEAYRKAFAGNLEAPIEIVSVRAAVRRPLPRRRESVHARPVNFVNPAQRSSAYSFALSRRVDFAVLDRSALPIGRIFDGPAIVHEPTATTYVDADFTFHAEPSGILRLSQQQVST